MPDLLIQSCSKSKRAAENPIPAIRLYSGYFFKIIKKARRDGAMVDDMDVCILSAKHGLIDEQAKIESYDRRMDASRANELAPAVQNTLSERLDGTYENIFINVGRDYRQAIDGISTTTDIPVYYIEGDGIGYKGKVLKKVIRGELNSIATDGLQKLT